jgi:integrase/recombinase XerC/integrase/recombinase XerD
MIQVLALQELHARHARYAQTLNKSENTITWYRVALNGYCRYLEEVCGVPAPITLKDFTLDAVRNYILYLRGQSVWAHHPILVPRQERTLSDQSVNCYVRSLRAFASWLYEQEYTETNLLSRLKAPRVTKKAVEILTDEEINQVLAALAAPTATNARNRAIFLTLLDTGIRASELLSLTLSRMHLDEGYLLVLGKGKKERPVKIGQTAAQAIRLYVARYRSTPMLPAIEEVFLTDAYRVPVPYQENSALQEYDDDGLHEGVHEDLHEELLFHQPGMPLTYDALKSLFHRLRKRAGILRLRPHLLRHTYACRYLLAHRDPLALKTMLGHTTLAMTNHYVAAVEGMQVIRSDRVSVVDAMGLAIGRAKRGNVRGRRHSPTGG